MVRYSHHNFYSNFTSSVRVGDTDLTLDLMLNELTDLIVFKTKKLVEALNKAGIKASESDTDETLIDKVLNNLDQNTNLVRALAFLFADENKLVNTKGITKEAALVTINNIADGIGEIGEQLGKKSSLKVSAKRDALKQVETKSKSVKDYKRTIRNRKNTGAGKTKFIVISVIVIGGIIAYVIYKRRQAAKSLELAKGLDAVGSAVPGTATPAQPAISAQPNAAPNVASTPANQAINAQPVTPPVQMSNAA